MIASEDINIRLLPFGATAAAARPAVVAAVVSFRARSSLSRSTPTTAAGRRAAREAAVVAYVRASLRLFLARRPVNLTGECPAVPSV